MKPFLLSILLFLSMSCSSLQKKDYNSPPGYDFNVPSKMVMPESLLEISGIAMYNNNPDTIYAIQDEQGKLFKVPLGVKEASKTKFGNHGDYEDLAILNKTFYILKSNGNIYSFPIADSYVEETDTTIELKGLLPKGEYESMYADNATGKLYVLCKNCNDDKKSGYTSGYILKQQNDSLTDDGGFQIDISGIEKALKSKIDHFRPSAMSRSPLTGDWYIISSVEKILVITGADWKVKEVIKLNSNTFNQPEGMAFDASNNLYISNEGSDINNGNILRFDYTSPK